MLVNKFLKLFTNTNLYPNRIIMNSFGYKSGFYLRNAHSPANVSESGIPHNLTEYTNYSFREYIENNNNFKNSVSEIINLSFPLDDKHNSLRLLVGLKEDSQNDDLWQEMLDCLSREISTFDVKDFLKVIALASSIKITTRSQNFSHLTAALDKELRSRTFKLDDFLEILFVLKHTLLMGKSLKNFYFYFKLYRRLEKLYRYEPLQVVHLFYYLEELSDTSKSMHKYTLLKYTKENLSQFNTFELGIILAGLTRAKLFATDIEFMQKITDTVLHKIENINSSQLFYISKFLLSCSSVHHSKIILNFQEKLIPYIPKFHMQSIVFALLSNYPYSLNISFWDAAVEKIKTNLKVLHLGDIQRVASITTAFKVKDKEFFKFAIEAVEENQEFDKSPSHLVVFCKHLVIHRIYPKNLLDKILSKDFVDNMISRSFKKEMTAWAFLNFSLQIDKPEHQCVCLNGVAEKKIMRKLFSSIILREPILCTVKTRMKLHRHLKAIYGENRIIETFCVPHFERGLIMRFDENLIATPIPENFKSGSRNLIKAPSDKHFWISINGFTGSLENLPPIKETYIRHLRAVGYKPVLVQEKEFYHYNKLGAEEVKKHIKDVIQTALQEILRERQKQ